MKANVLQLLRDEEGNYISGAKISEALNCSRTMVWKYIDALRKEGYEIEAVSNKGYCLIKEYDRLSKHELLSRLTDHSIFSDVIYEESTPSTQIIAQAAANEGVCEGTVVIADEQVSGRGRLGREWYSPPETGIWMSMILRPKVDFRRAPQLTLVTAVAVVRAIEHVTKLEAEIKWPNDLLLNGKKIAGILTEMQADPDQIKAVIIGVGINVNHRSFPEGIEDIATSLANESDRTFNRAELIAQILKEFEWLYDAYLTKGFSFIKPLWEARSNTIGRMIKARTANDVIEGFAEGIDEEGVLLLRDKTGDRHNIYSADIDIAKN
ncbi:biotin--[acetyl-CoA-carboxylase] ligase [Bacillus shivajii]|uniref:biotin--[acetyl-CoA-carboxylase] ligase n=1 Tax=Bacillus shivajii TaxID=1983719 RepID=UPI001CFB25DC|nr:biotin--[acetyl-CoA-carboxylase] ligase [Bacillus shivajii]UCZ54805.1 biotin--[acetyl-CoA-carboxylase] ligase [Bacillus shivajii]